MPKIKTPLLSFRADGSIGKAITFAQTQAGQIAKSIPSHRDARTLPQLYQRWRFRDACYYWRSLSNAARQAYKDTASPLRMTGWTYFLSIYLSNPLDQVLWLRLDEKGGAIAPDYSGNNNDGTIFGAIPAPGVIDGSYLFDRVDDRVDCGNDPTLDLTYPLTLMAWVTLTDPFDNTTPYWMAVLDHRTYYIALKQADGRLAFYLAGTLPLNTFSTKASWPANTPFHLAAKYDGANSKILINGILDNSTPRTGTPTSNPAWHAFVASWQGVADWFGGSADDPRIYTRALSDEHIYEIATTQYWPNPVI